MGKKKDVSKREPNGRASRRKRDVMEQFLADMDKDARETQGVALTARHRIFGVDPKHSRDQKAGSAAGRYCLQGLITQAQYDAAIMFLESHQRNLRAIDAPPQPGAVDLNATHGRPVGLENVKQLTKWRTEHKATLAAIQAKQNEIRLMGNLYGALASYNAGIDAVHDWRAAGLYAVPPAGGYWETADYAQVILRDYLRRRPDIAPLIQVPDPMPIEHVPGALRQLRDLDTARGGPRPPEYIPRCPR